METVCQSKQWDVALVFENDQIVAAQPYLIGRKMGLSYVLQPQLTQYNGPWFRPGTDCQRSSHQLVRHFRSLHLSLYRQCFAPGSDCFAGWEEYERQERVTYRIDDLSDSEEVFARFDHKNRQQTIRQAQRVLHPVEITPAQFASYHVDYWQSRGRKDLLAPQFMEHVITTACQRGNGLLVALADAEGRWHAERFVVYDSQCAYSLLSALNPEGHHKGATPLTYWLIMQQLAGKARNFDFEGSMTPSIATAYRQYGSVPHTYYQFTRCPNPLLRLLLNHII